MSIPIPQPSFEDSNDGAGRLEVSLAESGHVLLSSLGEDGKFYWFKLRPVEAVGLAAALAAYAKRAFDDS